jgi:hypothetical protein
MKKTIVTTIETKPREDAMSSNGAPTRTILQLDPEAGAVRVIQADSESAVTEPEYNGRILSATIQGHPIENEIRQYLESEEAQIAMSQIAAGYSRQWNGSAHRGHLNMDAAHSWAEFIEDLEIEFFTNYELWTAEEWIGEVTEITADTTDAEIAGIAAGIIADAEADRVYLSGNVEAHLKNTRTELQED